MKLRAALSELGAVWLERRLAPAFERCGKELAIVVTPAAAHLLLLRGGGGGGVEAHADVARDELFTTNGLRVRSNNSDRIGFVVDAGTLARVLRAAVGAGAGGNVTLKLVKRDATSAFLNVSAGGAGVDVHHDVPLLGPPLGRDELDAALAAASTSPRGSGGPPFWLQVDRQRLVHVLHTVDRLKSMRSTLSLAVVADGTLHVRAGPGLGAEYRGLRVWPVERDEFAGAQATFVASAATPAARLARAQLGAANDDTASVLEVLVAAKDLARALQFHITQPDDVLVGVAASRTYVEFAFRFEAQSSSTVVGSVGLGVKVPVQVDEDV